jgi:hypothetical protein
MKFCFYTVALLTLLGACSTASVDKSTSAIKNPVLGRSAIVTMGSLNLEHTKPSTFSWSDGVEIVGERDGVSNAELQQQIQGIVESQIVSKGYPVLPVNGDFQLHATLIIASDSDKQTLLHETGGIDPGLMGGDQGAGKGSLMLELRQGRALRWRGAVQIYILPEYDPVIARQRIERAVAQLLLTWP